MGTVAPPSSVTSTRTRSAATRNVTVTVPPAIRELLCLMLFVTSSEVSKATLSAPG